MHVDGNAVRPHPVRELLLVAALAYKLGRQALAGDLSTAYANAADIWSPSSSSARPAAGGGGCGCRTRCSPSPSSWSPPTTTGSTARHVRERARTRRLPVPEQRGGSLTHLVGAPPRQLPGHAPSLDAIRVGMEGAGI
jgi:hypothetical protein